MFFSGTTSLCLSRPTFIHPGTPSIFELVKTGILRPSTALGSCYANFYMVQSLSLFIVWMRQGQLQALGVLGPRFRWNQLPTFAKPGPGPCSIEIMYPREWRIAIPASLMRVDDTEILIQKANTCICFAIVLAASGKKGRRGGCASSRLDHGLKICAGRLR